jgi:hypothetical protein
MHVMRLRTAVADEFVSDEQRERQIRQAAAVQMSELAMAASKLGTAESMPALRHTGPRRDFPDDSVVDGLGHYWLSLWFRVPGFKVQVLGSRF